MFIQFKTISYNLIKKHIYKVIIPQTHSCIVAITLTQKIII